MPKCRRRDFGGLSFALDSRRCVEHGLFFLPGFWAMILSAGSLEDSRNTDLAPVLGIQNDNPK